VHAFEVHHVFLISSSHLFGDWLWTNNGANSTSKNRSSLGFNTHLQKYYCQLQEMQCNFLDTKNVHEQLQQASKSMMLLSTTKHLRQQTFPCLAVYTDGTTLTSQLVIGEKLVHRGPSSMVSRKISKSSTPLAAWCTGYATYACSVLTKLFTLTRNPMQQ